ncbi:MAG: biopolymer transporter ExbD [Candidatus Delongbacteria bacterium]|nr:biopolymer transporter ExbD [Candidatus Delongbacteria bacterium]
MLKKRKKGDIDIPTSSLSDIVFLLIIFFLVTTTMNKDKGLGIVLPPHGEAKDIPKKNMCNVSINPAGEVMVDDVPVPESQIARAIKKRMEGNPNLIVSLKANEEAEYGMFISVFDELKKTGCDKISIANYER